MAELIRGRGVELEKAEDTVTRASSNYNIEARVVEYSSQFNQVRAAVEEMYEPKARIKGLEKMLRQGGELLDTINDNQEQYNLGVLTTLYVMEKYTNEDGVVVLPNLGFLNKFGLAGASYKLVELANAVIDVVDSISDQCLQKCQNVHIERVSNGGENFVEDSSDVVINTVEDDGQYFGAKSTAMRVNTVESSGSYFGFRSEGMEVGLVSRCSIGFGSKSKDMRVGRVEEAIADFGHSSETMKIGKVESAGRKFGDQSNQMKVGKVTSSDFGFGQSSNDLSVESVDRTTGYFGYMSGGLTVGSIGQALDHFGKDSNGLSVGTIDYCDNEFAEGSTKLRATEIKSAGRDFGKSSTGLQIKQIDQLVEENFLTGSRSTVIYSVPKLTQHIDSYAYAVREKSGRIHTNLGTSGVDKLREVFGLKKYDATLGILRITDENTGGDNGETD